MGGCWEDFAGRYLGSRAAVVRRGRPAAGTGGGAFSAGGAYERGGFFGAGYRGRRKSWFWDERVRVFQRETSSGAKLGVLLIFAREKSSTGMISIGLFLYSGHWIYAFWT